MEIIMFILGAALITLTFFSIAWKSERDSYKRQLEYADHDKDFWKGLYDALEKQYFAMLKQNNKSRTPAKTKTTKRKIK